MAKSNKPALFAQVIVQLDTFRETCRTISSPFFSVSEKVQSWDTSKDGKCCCSLMDLLNSYLMVSSVVGFYSLRVFEALTPRKDDTTMTTVRTELKNRLRGEVGARALRLPQMC